jgi:hypothetical protein
MDVAMETRSVSYRLQQWSGTNKRKMLRFTRRIRVSFPLPPSRAACHRGPPYLHASLSLQSFLHRFSSRHGPLLRRRSSRAPALRRLSRSRAPTLCCLHATVCLPPSLNSLSSIALTGDATTGTLTTRVVGHSCCGAWAGRASQVGL